MAEGKLHRAADEIDDEIYFREELLVLRRERLVEVAPVTNLRVLSVYASRGLWAYGGDVVAFGRDVFEWVVLPADGFRVVNMTDFAEEYGVSRGSGLGIVGWR